MRATAAHSVITPGIKTCWTEVTKSPCLEDCFTSWKGVLLILRAPGLRTPAGHHPRAPLRIFFGLGNQQVAHNGKSYALIIVFRAI